MASILMSLEHDVEVGAEDVLRFVTNAKKKLTSVEPSVVAGLGVILDKVAQVAGDATAAAATPANIELDQATLADIKAVWPAIKAFAQEIGIKL